MNKGNERNLYKKNIILNYIFNFTKNLDITQGIWMLFLASKGVSLFGLGVLEGLFHVTSFLMETPTGAIADLYGRKLSRVLGRLFNILATLLIIFGDSYLAYLISFIILPISYNLESGAGEALMYDSLIKLGEEDRFMKYNGLLEVVYQMASVCALIIGGIIGTFSYKSVYIVAVAISFLAFIQSLFFKEVVIDSKKEKKSYSIFEAIKKQYIDSISAIKNNGRLAYLMIFSAFMSTFLTASFYYLQNYWKEYGFGEWTIGLFLALSSIGGGLGGLLTTRIEAKLGEERLIKFMPFIMVFGLWGLVFIKFSFVFFIALSFTEAIVFVAVSAYINKLIDSDMRATIISFESMVFSFGMICIFPLFGLVSDMVGIRIAFSLLATLATVMSLINYRLLVRNK